MLDNAHDTRWFVYMIETDKNHLYTGITTDVERRFQQHINQHSGKGKLGAKFFNSQKPLRVCYTESFSNRSLASQREAAIKRLTRKEKLRLIETSGGKDHCAT